MLKEKLAEAVRAVVQGVRQGHDLIHCITNPISINDGANLLLAVGARPIMAEHPREVAEITATAKALALNLGNITDVRMESMLIAGRTARAKGLPVIVDLVGAACSRLRLEYAQKLIAECRPTVIKGNISELRAVCGLTAATTGVEAAAGELVTTENAAAYGAIFGRYAKEQGVTLLASGPLDMLVDSEGYLLAANGTAYLAGITGTGCMLNVLAAACLAAAATQGISPRTACLAACLLLEIAGEQAAESWRQYGPGSFHIALLDRINKVTEEELLAAARVIL